MDEVDDVDELGPVDWIVVEFPGSKFNGQIAPALLDLVERDLIRVLDLLVLKKDADGSLEAFELSDLDQGEIGEFQDVRVGADAAQRGGCDLARRRNRAWQLCRCSGVGEHLGRTVRSAVRRSGGRWSPAAASPSRRCSPPSKLTRKKKPTRPRSS